MIERYISTGPEVKLCQRCKIPFERPDGMHIGNWKQCIRCPKHRNKKGSHKPAEPKLGHYEVKSKVIDNFLYRKT